MATFSWSDTARAVFGTCLPCLQSSERHTDNSDDRQQSARRDELESLLQGAEFSDAEMDADALSLHSRLGQQDGRKRIRKKRGRKKGSITLFGYDLFGRPLSGPPGEDNVSDRGHDHNQRISRISSSTLDSDAAPLADDAIAELSTAQIKALREADEAREARSARKRMRKMARRLGEQDSEFEGFPGSGPPQDEFGAFQQGQPIRAESEFVEVEGGGPNEMYGDADADFDATSYVRSAAPRSDSGSGSRSHTSASVSNMPYLMPAHRVPLPPSSQGSGSSAPPTPKSRRSKKSGKRSAATVSSASQPRSPTEVYQVPRVAIASPTFEGFPEDEAFSGHPQDGGMTHQSLLKLTNESVHGDITGSASSPQGFPSPGLSNSRLSGFPSPGLGGRKKSLSISGKGVYLARTGEDA